MHVKLHLIEHTHDDVGWNLDIPDYFTTGTHKNTNSVRVILDTASQGLSDSIARKFTYVEIAFFQLWWREQTPEWRAEVKALVRSGQLEFTNAGWCMSDEATSHFADQVDQMTIGHLWIQAQFGRDVAKPTVGWHIDPFGHTTGTAFLFAKMGFNMFQFGRWIYIYYATNHPGPPRPELRVLSRALYGVPCMRCHVWGVLFTACLKRNDRVRS